MDISSFSAVGYIFCGLFKVLEKNATGFPFWLSATEISTLLAFVSITMLRSLSMDINITSLRSFIFVLKAFLAQFDRGNTSVCIKGRFLSRNQQSIWHNKRTNHGPGSIFLMF